MANFTVSWWVTFFDQEPELHYLVNEDIEADDLDELFDKLDEGIQEDEFTPEEQIPNNWGLGNLNLEYGIITDESGKEVYRDEDFKDEMVPAERRL